MKLYFGLGKNKQINSSKSPLPSLFTLFWQFLKPYILLIVTGQGFLHGYLEIPVFECVNLCLAVIFNIVNLLKYVLGSTPFSCRKV